MKRFLAKKCYLRIVACVMVFCMCATAFAGNVGIGAFADGAISVWDGTDTYADLAAVLADLGDADADGYYHITTPNQLHAVIRLNGGGNKYKLDNNIYLNENYEDYATWGTTAPANQWSFNTNNYYSQASNYFRGTIDGCGHTIYGLYSNGGKANNGLIGQTGATTLIKNLNVWYSYVKASSRVAGILVGSAYAGGWSETVVGTTIEGCSVRYAAVDVAAGNTAFGGIVGLVRRKTTISYCSVADITINPTYNKGSTENNYGAIASIAGASYDSNSSKTGKDLNKTQARMCKILNCYAVNVVNTAVDNEPVYVAGVFKDSGWGNSVSAYNVYTDATKVSCANDANIKLFVSLDGEKAVSASDANYPIRTISANGIKGDAAKTAMPYLCWDFWKTVDNDYPVYVDNDKSTATNVWDGTTDTYEDIEEVISALGATDAEGYYHITIPAQLHAVINHQGGGYNYRLDNDLVLNSDYKNYAAWQYTRNQPANTWAFNQSQWHAASTPFSGTIDGCGHTVYGLYSNEDGYYNGLIGATESSSTIKNLNVYCSYLYAGKNAGVIIGINTGNLSVSGCSVRYASLAGAGNNTPAGGIVALSKSVTKINNCAVADVKFSGTVAADNASGQTNPYSFGSFIGGIYRGMRDISNTGTIDTTQSQSNVVRNSYAVNVINATNNNLVHICGLFSQDTSWANCVKAGNVYTDATVVPTSNTDPQVILLISANGTGISSPSDANYPIYTVTASGLLGSSAKNVMSKLNWTMWNTLECDYPYYANNGVLWDGTDSYADLDELLTDLGSADSEGYYHITLPSQLHAAIRFQGGANKFKLDNDLFINENYEDYENWGSAAPENTWQFNQASNWDANSMTPFTGTIDGCGHTIYGLFSDTTGNYNGLIGATTGATVINNLNVRYGYLNAAKRAGVIVGCKRGGTLTVDSCSVSNIYIKGGAHNTPAGGIVGITYPNRTEILNTAINDIKFTATTPANSTSLWENSYAFGSFIGAPYMDIQTPDNAQTVNHTQADYNVIKNSYAKNVKNVTNGNSLVYICGLFHEGSNADNNTKWGYSVTATDVYTDATTIPCSNLVSPQVSLLVTDDGYRTNNTIKTPSADNYAGLFNSGAWYKGIDNLPIQKIKTADFEYLDITGEVIDDAYNSADLTCVINYLLGKTGYKYILGDITGEGLINLLDLIKLKKIIACQVTTWDGPTGYKIVYASGNDYAHYLALRLQDYFAAKSKVILDVVSDSTAEATKEILVGDTNRYSTSLTENKYAVTFDNQKLIFEGGHQATLEKAVTLFTSQNLISNQINTLKGTASDFSSTRTIDGKTYSYVWGDEFDGTTLNLDKFTYDYHGFGSGYENGTYTSYKADNKYYSSDYAKVANGLFTLRAEMDSDGNVKNGEGLCTSDTMWYKYGYAEIRAKISLKRGAWPSWWATDACGKVSEYPFDITDREYLVEVDMFESFAEGDIYANIHKWYDAPYITKFNNAGIENSYFQPTNPNTGASVTQSESRSSAFTVSNTEEYHTFGFLWTPSKMQMFIDGVAYATYDLTNSSLLDGYTDNDGFKNPMHLIFENGLFLEGCRGARDDGRNATYEDLPIEYSIDYVRLYQTSGNELYNLGLQKCLTN